MNEHQILEERKKKFSAYFKKNNNWVVYLILAAITLLAVRIRSLNLSRLRDVTTGQWTLGPDLDPFLFLRWAKYIVENGSLFSVDVMRYVPLYFETNRELLFLPYSIAWFHKLASIFGSTSVEQSAVLYPVFMFALTVIAFFFLVRKIFIKSLGKKRANLISLLAVFFLSISPSLLPRTIAGIPEKESVAFLFMFLAFYFFISSWQARSKTKIYLLAILAGISTAAMAHTWGGYAFIPLTIAPMVFLSFLFKKVNKERFYSFGIWILTSALIMIPFSARYSVKQFITSINTGSSVAVFLIIGIHFLIYNTRIRDFLPEKSKKIPNELTSTIISIVLFILLLSLFLGPSYIPNRFSDVYNSLVTPADSRLIQTVAENRQPFLTEWSGSFGPIWNGVPSFFWIFLIGSIYLFYTQLHFLRKKERNILTISFAFFISSIVFSRYDSNSIFNGTNLTSLSFYFLGFASIIGFSSYYYYQYHKRNELNTLKEVKLGFILILMLFILTLIGARGAIRLVMMLVPAASIIASYFIINFSLNSFNRSSENKRTLYIILASILILITLFASYQTYLVVNQQASAQVPNAYTHQWQKAMSWVRENTSEGAVFAHWWDYGYWVQSIGNRPTILDGGNVYSYWNHLLGRNVLTTPKDISALQFLYTHNASYLLIDSTDIGKYPAFSSIGSNENYDRRSYLASFGRVDSQTQQKENSLIYVYQGGSALDEDIIYEQNGERIFLPSGKTGIGAFLVEIDSSGSIKQPIGIFVYNGKQYQIPLRYAYSEELVDFNSGLNAGIYLYPSIRDNQVIEAGHLMYLSPRTIDSLLVRLYLFNQDNPNFRLVHTQSDLSVEQIKEQVDPNYPREIINFNGVRGPIKIWEIKYPSGIKQVEEYLETKYPDERLELA